MPPSGTAQEERKGRPENPRETHRECATGADSRHLSCQKEPAPPGPTWEPEGVCRHLARPEAGAVPGLPLRPGSVLPSQPVPSPSVLTHHEAQVVASDGDAGGLEPCSEGGRGIPSAQGEAPPTQTSGQPEPNPHSSRGGPRGETPGLGDLSLLACPYCLGACRWFSHSGLPHCLHAAHTERAHAHHPHSQLRRYRGQTAEQMLMGRPGSADPLPQRLWPSGGRVWDRRLSGASPRVKPSRGICCRGGRVWGWREASPRGRRAGHQQLRGGSPFMLSPIAHPLKPGRCEHLHAWALSPALGASHGQPCRHPCPCPCAAV